MTTHSESYLGRKSYSTIPGQVMGIEELVIQLRRSSRPCSRSFKDIDMTQQKYRQRESPSLLASIRHQPTWMSPSKILND